jgi:hypothetical protein
MFEMIHLSDHFVSGLLFSVRIGGSLVLRKTMGVHGSEKQSIRPPQGNIEHIPNMFEM